MPARPIAPGHERWDEAVEAFERNQAGETVAQISRDTGTPTGTITNWLKRMRALGYGLSEGVKESIEAAGLTPSEAKGGWRHVYDDDGKKTGTVRWAISSDSDAESVSEVIEASCEYLKDRSPYVASPVYAGGHHMMVLTPADIHMGKLSEALETGDEYTQEIAEKRTKEGVAALLEIGKGFGLECITVNTGNDSLHVDNSRKTTTSGTPQDTQGSIFSMFTAMQRTWIWVIEQCAEIAPVRVVFDPSNHPWVSDWMLNQSLAAWFHNDERVTFDVYQSAIRHRKYQVYGSNLIGYAHGDGAKSKDLPMVMQYEAREWWGRTLRGYWIVKHTHHKDAKAIGIAPYQMEKDHPGVTVIRSGDNALDRNVAVEVVRSPSGADGWHDRNGFVGAIKAVEAFLFHSERGQIARFTYPFYEAA